MNEAIMIRVAELLHEWNAVVNPRAIGYALTHMKIVAEEKEPSLERTRELVEIEVALGEFYVAFPDVQRFTKKD